MDADATEAPYPALLGLDPAAAWAIFLASPAPGITLGYYLWVQRWDGATWNPAREEHVTTPSGILVSAQDCLSDEINVYAGPDTYRLDSVGDEQFAVGANVCRIRSAGGEEFIAFRTVMLWPDGTGFTLSGIARGCIDTIPRSHASGGRVWFFSYGCVIGTIPIPSSEEMSHDAVVRFQAFNARSLIPFGDALERTCLALNPSRAERPYCPTAVKFNLLSYPTEITGELTISWSHRSRLQGWLYSNSGATYSPEGGLEYRITVYGELETVVHVESIAAESSVTEWNYESALEISESGLGRLNVHLRVRQ